MDIDRRKIPYYCSIREITLTLEHSRPRNNMGTEAPLRAVIFDLDGTLVNSLGHIASACNHVLRKLRLPQLPEEQYASLAGGGNRKLLARTLQASTKSVPSDSAVTAAVKMKRAYDDEVGASNAVEFDGISEMLQALSDSELQLAVLSNKAEHLVRLVVEKCFPSIKFVAVHGARDNVPLKPSPVPALDILQRLSVRSEECAFVGDTQIDVETGNAAGMVSVAVAWGFRSANELLHAGAKYVARDPRDLTSILMQHGK